MQWKNPDTSEASFHFPSIPLHKEGEIVTEIQLI